MIDFTKIIVPKDYAAALLKHPALSFERPVNEDTGQLNSEKARVASFGSMKFEIHNSNRIELYGSLHKHFHNGRNCTDFTFSQFVECVNVLCHQFRFDPAQLQLLQLEIGVNIITNENPERIINSLVCNWTGQPFSRMRTRNNDSLGKELYLTEYGYKIYNKGKQYSLPFHLLRYELKMKSGKFFRRHGIDNLSDLLKLETWECLSNILSHSCDKLILKEPTMSMKSLSPNNREFIILAGTSDYWNDRKPQQRMKSRNRFAKLIKLHGTGNLKTEVLEYIFTKCPSLMDVKDSVQSTPKKGDVFPNNSTLMKNDKGLCFPTSNNAGNYHPESIPVHVRMCKSCGRDISGQRKGSIFCSETFFGKSVKRCRNIDSNPRNNFARSLARIEMFPLLFDHHQYIKYPNFVKSKQRIR